MNKFLKNILFISLSFILLISVLIFSVLWAYSNSIPDYKFLKNYKPPVSSKVYSGDGELVADFSKEKRIFVPYSSIPKNVINSFLSAEDKNFFSHPGVDAKGVLRAVINNISNIFLSKRLEGASTITQQVAKNFLLTNEVSINRKFFATCCVIVDAPSSRFEVNKFWKLLIIALRTPFASTPGCEKKFLSSADRKESITFLGIAL